MSTAAEPMRTTRVAVLTITWCFSVIAASVGLNALIKSNQQKSHLKKLAPAPTVVEIDTSDIFNVGVLATTISLILSILGSKSLLGMFFGPTKRLINNTLRVQSYIGFLFVVILIGTMIPYTYYFATRHAIVTAFVGGKQLPDAVVKAVEQSSGSTGVYKEIGYLRLVAIFGWISVVFNAIACAVLFKAGGVAKNAPRAAPAAAAVSHSSPSTTMKEEEPVHIDEKAEV